MAQYTTKVSPKGQVVIPKNLQAQLQLPDGVLVELQIEESTAVLRKAPSWVERTRGALATNHPQIEPEEMEELIEAAALIEAFENHGECK